MGHEIYGSLCYTRDARSKPAWHQIDHLVEMGIEERAEGYTANEMLDLMGEPRIIEIPLPNVHLAGEDGGAGWDLPTGMKLVARMPYGDETVPLVMNVLSQDYEVINPRKAATLFDEFVLQPFEAKLDTMLFIHKGKELVITTRLPDFEVQGDTHQSYLIYNNPMDGSGAVTSVIADVRVVCWNTQQAALRSATARIAIDHRPGCADLLGSWMHRQYEHAADAANITKQAYDVLAGQVLEPEEHRAMTNRWLPIPTMPIEDAPYRTPYQERLKQWERACDKTKALRGEMVDLFKGKATGFENHPAEGSAYHWFNCATELTTWRRYANSGSFGADALIGDRANQIRKAFVIATQATPEGTFKAGELLPVRI